MTVVATGIDISAKPYPTPDQLAAHDPPLTFVLSYLSSPGGIDKDWHADALAMYRAAGVDVGFVFEDAENDWTGGAPAGRGKAAVARTRLEALGEDPDGGPVFNAVDAGITPSYTARVGVYQDGWNTLFRPANRAAYGNNRVMTALFATDRIAYGWEMQWGTPGLWHPQAQLRQHGQTTVGGVPADLDTAHAPNWGQWKGTGVSQADVEAGVRAVFRLPPGVSFDVIAGQTDNRVALAMVGAIRGAEFNDARAVLGALAGIRQALGPSADRENAILAALAALHITLDPDQVRELATELALDADAVAAAVAHRVTVTLGTATP